MFKALHEFDSNEGPVKKSAFANARSTHRGAEIQQSHLTSGQGRKYGHVSAVRGDDFGVILFRVGTGRFHLGGWLVLTVTGLCVGEA